MSFARSLPLFISFLLVAQVPVPAEPARANISLSLEYYEKDLQWNATDQSFSFNGTLTLEDTLNREIDVTISTVAPAGWSATCEPAVNTFYSPGQRTFTCTARYPQQTGSMNGTLMVYGTAYWRGDALVTNQSPPFTVRLTRLPVEKYINLTNPHKIDFTTRLENILPHLEALAVILAVSVAAAAAWRWRRKKKEALQ